jgi:DNA-binding NarL/FixJ family response regulator
MKKTRILLIEDNFLMRQGLTAMIGGQPDLKIVSVFGEGEKSELKIRESNPDLILIDFNLQSKNSLQLVKAINKKFPDLKTIILDYIPAQSDIIEFVQAGISGFILKDAIAKEFLQTIRSVAKGDKVLPSNLSGSLFSQIKKQASNKEKPNRMDVRMTKREREIIHLIAEGLSNKEIVGRLNLSLNTVKSHIHNILEKMALHTRVQIAKYAYSNNGYKNIADTISLLDE